MHHRVLEVPHTPVVKSAHGHDLLYAQPMKLRHKRVTQRSVDLVHGQHGRLPGSTHKRCSLLISRNDSIRRRNHEYDDIGLGDCKLGLPLHLGPDGRVRIDTPPSGVDNSQVATLPRHGEEQPVPGDIRLVVDNDVPGADDAIEKRGLANVGPANESNNRSGHQRTPLVRGKEYLREYGLLNVQPVLCLVEHDRSRPVQHV